MHDRPQKARAAMEIPDREACKGLMDRYGMLPNIIEHSYRVAQLSCFLARALNRSGLAVQEPLVRAAALLHDITKTRSLATKEKHAATGRDLLLDLGYPSVAAIVGLHVDLGPDNRHNEVSEAHVVHYSDKRVLHAAIVSLDERFKDLVVRYGKSNVARERIERLGREALALEKRVFAHLDFSPDSLESFNALSAFDLTGLSPGSPGDQRE